MLGFSDMSSKKKKEKKPTKQKPSKLTLNR